VRGGAVAVRRACCRLEKKLGEEVELRVLGLART
jgi:hypothetical protein